MLQLLFSVLFIAIIIWCSVVGFFLTLVSFYVCKIFSLKINTTTRIAHFFLFYLPLKLMPCWKVQKEGKHDWDSKSKIFICNHISLLDILVIFQSIPLHTRIIGRADQAKFPFIGWTMVLAGDLFIEFETGNKAVSTTVKDVMQKCQKILRTKDNESVMIFPEGFLNNSPNKLLSFKDGAFRLSIESGRDIIPFIIINANKAVPPFLDNNNNNNNNNKNNYNNNNNINTKNIYNYLVRSTNIVLSCGEKVSPHNCTLGELKECAKNRMDSLLFSYNK